MLEGKFRTGPFSHELVTGLSWQKQIDRYDTNGVSQDLGLGNIYVPNTHNYASDTAFTMARNSDITQKSFFASDTVQLTERWSVLGGVRFTDYEQNSYLYQPSSYRKNGVVTPTVAVMFKPVPAATVYASYVEALQAGSVVARDSGLANAGAQLDPLRSKQYEIGVKADQQRWSATAALFRIEKGAEYTSGNVLVQDGLSIYQGAELAGLYRLGGGFELGGSAMWLDSYYDKGSSFDGQRVAGAPRWVLAARADWRVPMLPGLRVGVDGKYTGNMGLAAGSPIELGGYTVYNLGASYYTRIGGHDVTLRAALNNVTNKRYWNFQYAGYVQPGDPRNVSLNTKIAF